MPRKFCYDFGEKKNRGEHILWPYFKGGPQILWRKKKAKNWGKKRVKKC